MDLNEFTLIEPHSVTNSYDINFENDKGNLNYKFEMSENGGMGGQGGKGGLGAWGRNGVDKVGPKNTGGTGENGHIGGSGGNGGYGGIGGIGLRLNTNSLFYSFNMNLVGGNAGQGGKGGQGGTVGMGGRRGWSKRSTIYLHQSRRDRRIGRNRRTRGRLRNKRSNRF